MRSYGAEEEQVLYIDHVEKIVEILDEVKTLIPDQKYIEMMEALGKINEKLTN